VCTNALFEIKSNDDGTWRRMKLVDFLAKFISEGETHTDDTKHIFSKDKSLKEKLPNWAPIFISMLIKRACETNGEVKDCMEVVAASNKYRQSQDCITGFIADKIIISENGSIDSKISLNAEFKKWFEIHYGNRKSPKLAELIEIIQKQFKIKVPATGKIRGIVFKEDDEPSNDLDEINN
jgi:phage/plasmid-associated DNA primase